VGGLDETPLLEGDLVVFSFVICFAVWSSLGFDCDLASAPLVTWANVMLGLMALFTLGGAL
jgi:hypothetical protein